MDGTFANNSPINEKDALVDEILKEHAKSVYNKLRAGQDLTDLEKTKLQAAEKLSRKVNDEGINASAYQFRKLREEHEKTTLNNFLQNIQSANMNADRDHITYDSTALSKTIRYIDRLDSDKIEQLKKNKVAYNQFCLKAHKIMSAPARKGKVGELNAALTTTYRVTVSRGVAVRSQNGERLFKLMVEVPPSNMQVDVPNEDGGSDTGEILSLEERALADTFEIKTIPHVIPVGPTIFFPKDRNPPKLDLSYLFANGVDEDYFLIIEKEKRTRNQIFSVDGSINSAANRMPPKLKAHIDGMANQPDTKEELKSETSLKSRLIKPFIKAMALAFGLVALSATPLSDAKNNFVIEPSPLDASVVLDVNMSPPAPLTSNFDAIPSVPDLSNFNTQASMIVAQANDLQLNTDIDEESYDSTMNVSSAPILSTDAPIIDTPNFDKSVEVMNANFNDVTVNNASPASIEAPIKLSDTFSLKTQPYQSSTLTFETIPHMVKAYYDMQNIEIPNTLQVQFDKFNVGMREVNNPAYKGHAEEATFEILKISTREFGADFLNSNGYEALDLIQSRDGVLGAKGRAENAENFYKMKYPAVTMG